MKMKRAKPPFLTPKGFTANSVTIVDQAVDLVDKVEYDAPYFRTC